MLENYRILQIAALFLVISCIALLVNFTVFQFPGNNYFPPHTVYILFSFGLTCLGSQLFFGNKHLCTRILKEILFFFMVMGILVVATNAAQFTPFKPIDKTILALQLSFFPSNDILLNWIHQHILLKQLMEYIYDSLTYQMTYIPLIVILMKKFNRIRIYYFLLLITALLGYSFYYFFPTTAPASMIESQLFSSMQRATGLKFFQIHHYIQPTTIEGGMIAFPSFHVIWAYLCVWLVQDWKILYYPLLSINIVLVASCVILGWHYWLDLLGSVTVISLGHLLYYLMTQKNIHLIKYRSQSTAS